MLFQITNSPLVTLICSSPFEIMILSFLEKKKITANQASEDKNENTREGGRKEGEKVTTNNTQETSKNDLKCSRNLRRLHFGLFESKAVMLVQVAVCSFSSPACLSLTLDYSDYPSSHSKFTISGRQLASPCISRAL